MLDRGARVICTSRNPENLGGLTGAEIYPLDVSHRFSLEVVPQGSLVLHSIPPLEGENPNSSIVDALENRPARVVYLSTTGVYGDQRDVNASSMPAPRHAKDIQRLTEEAAICSGPWHSMVLRPAAIYGPGRGIHVSMQQGRFQLVDGGENYVSRIHVDDLAAHAEAALLSNATGAWPVADEHPCTSREIAKYCSELLGLPMPGSVPATAAHPTRRADRRVDGSAVRDVLGISLLYPSYLKGIPASLV